jgi:hypothetical protein
VDLNTGRDINPEITQGMKRWSGHLEITPEEKSVKNVFTQHEGRHCKEKMKTLLKMI